MFALCSAISSSINQFDGGVSAFVVPMTTTTKRTSLSLPSAPKVHSDELPKEENDIVIVPESRRVILGRAAGGFAATTLTLLSMPSSGIAAAAPAKVRVFEPSKLLCNQSATRKESCVTSPAEYLIDFLHYIPNGM
jgi:hypothetical protein